MGQIYKHTAPNGKCYVGRTIHTWQVRAGKIPEQNYSSKFRNAIIKYGWDNFTHEVLEEIENFDVLCERELYWINFYDSIKNGYNLISIGYPSKRIESDWNPDSNLLRKLYVEEKYSSREMIVFFNKHWNLIKQALIDNGIEIHQKNFISKSQKIRRVENSWIHNRIEIECARTDCSEKFLPKRSNQKFCSKSCSGKLGAQNSSESTNNGAPLGNKNAIGNKGGKRTSHNRWHVNRGIISNNCEFCKEN